MGKVYEDTRTREDAILAKICESNEKADFVFELGRFMRKYYEEIKGFRYHDAMELVLITYKNGHVAEINVAGDSLAAIMYDIGKYLCEH